MKHAHDIAEFIKTGDFETTDAGLLIHKAIMAKGVYVHSVNGKDEQEDPNLIPSQGILYILGAALGNVTPITTWYLALYSGNSTPVAGWTAANFTANAVEIVSQTEGYTGTDRKTWTPGVASAGAIGNLSSRAAFDIATTTTVSIRGAGLLSSAPRGSTSGTLVSASLFAQPRTLVSGDVFELGYSVTLTDS
jgi:hypothetical protein